MTRGVDIELLADYVGGALEGTEQRAVADLVATVPSWTRAYRQMVAADAAIRGLLGAAPAAPIPQDVAARLDAAFASERRGVPASADPAWPVLERSSGPPAPGGSTGPRGAPTARRGPGRGRRRPLRRLLPVVGSLVAVLFVVLVGGKFLLNPAVRPGNSANAPAQYEDSSAGGAVGAPQTQRGSGLDYTPTSLPAIGAPVPGSDNGSAAPTPSPVTAGSKGLNGQTALPPALDRFGAPGALVNCLNAITTEVPVPQAARAELYDLATFQGQPAVIVVYEQGGIVARVLVAGSQCGATGADLLYQVPAR